MRTIHRIVMMFAVIFTLYIGVTGSWMQAIDLQALMSHAPATDPNVLSIREGISGPPGFPVIEAADYDAPPLPASLDLQAVMGKTLSKARAAAGAGALDYLELRMEDGKPVGQALSGRRLLRFDAVTGAALSAPQPTRGGPRGPRSPHDQVKEFHRMSAFGDWAGWLDLASGIGLFVMIVTGLVLYFSLIRSRARIGRTAVFWSAGGAWRTLHRGVALVSAAFLLVVAVTGIMLVIDNLSVNSFIAQGGFFKMGNTASPLADSKVPGMLRVVENAYENANPGAPMKVIRLRVFAGQPQGVVITGGAETRQLVFNAVTGARASETEPGYPYSGFPFGWEEHELVKQIHRGDYFGLTGRWMDLLTGLSMIFLSISGLVMYFTLWASRRALGRSSLFWR